MKLLYRFICAWRGHSDVQNDHQGWVCLCCERQMDYDEAIKTPIRSRIIQWWHERKEWLKCSECGRRFGRHNDTPHIPF